MEIVLILAVGALNIACFLIGAKVGQRVAKGEKIELPSANPVKAVREHNESTPSRSDSGTPHVRISRRASPDDFSARAHKRAKAA